MPRCWPRAERRRREHDHRSRGGTLSAPDGALTLIIAAGALASDTAIGIQPLTNTAHGRRGVAYRLTPDVQAFAQPIELKFTYTDQDLQGTAIEALGAAFQRADGMWQWAGDPTVDAPAKTLSVKSTHCSDWSNVAGLRIRPGSKPLEVKANLGLRVRFASRPTKAIWRAWPTTATRARGGFSPS